MTDLMTTHDIELLLGVKKGYIQRFRPLLSDLSKFPKPTFTKVFQQLTYSRKEVLKWSETHDIHVELRKCFREKNKQYQWKKEDGKKSDIALDFITGKIGLVRLRKHA